MPNHRAANVFGMKYFGAFIILTCRLYIVSQIQQIADVQSPIQLSSQNDFLY